MPVIDRLTLDRLYERSGAARWSVTPPDFAAALESSVANAFKEGRPDDRDLTRYLDSLHLEDLALACACHAGSDPAWEHFIRVQRPLLYRAADGMDASGRARELADGLYADLWRRSLFRYFHGRSSLTTWLRAVLAQRHVDRIRADRRTDPLPEDESTLPATTAAADPNRLRWQTLVSDALRHAAAALPPKDRLRLGCYYAQDMTLAAIGRLLGEHEATVSRHVTRSRKALRETMERYLREQGKMTETELTECLASLAEDSGTIDVWQVLMSRTQE
jgi:RNA polymerase sigma factor (sigma-70 family)